MTAAKLKDEGIMPTILRALFIILFLASHIFTTIASTSNSGEAFRRSSRDRHSSGIDYGCSLSNQSAGDSWHSSRGDYTNVIQADSEGQGGVLKNINVSNVTNLILYFTVGIVFRNYKSVCWNYAVADTSTIFLNQNNNLLS